MLYSSTSEFKLFQCYFYDILGNNHYNTSLKFCNIYHMRKQDASITILLEVLNNSFEIMLQYLSICFKEKFGTSLKISG